MTTFVRILAEAVCLVEKEVALVNISIRIVESSSPMRHPIRPSANILCSIVPDLCAVAMLKQALYSLFADFAFDISSVAGFTTFELCIAHVYLCPLLLVCVIIFEPIR